MLQTRRPALSGNALKGIAHPRHDARPPHVDALPGYSTDWMGARVPPARPRDGADHVVFLSSRAITTRTM